MLFKKNLTENERLFTAVIIVFVVYFGLNSVIFAVFGEDSVAVHYLMSVSFLGGMFVGGIFFLLSRPKILETDLDSVITRNLGILKKGLSDDEKTLVDIISESEGITQDSIKYRTGFSKSKVSLILSEMEKRNIIQRETLGRTNKVFISDWLKK